MKTTTIKQVLFITGILLWTSLVFSQETASIASLPINKTKDTTTLISTTKAKAQKRKIVMTGKGAPVYVATKDSIQMKNDSTPKVPFAFGDFTWLNGNDRRHSALLDTKYVTGRVLVDANATYSNQDPIDHTVIGSTTLAQDNVLELNCVALGGDFHDSNVRGSVLLQLGTRSTVVPRNDNSGYHGQYDLQDAYRYFSEANAGYHFNVWNGINVDAGLFMSYIGLFSYYNAENWCYQPSFTSDNTPWFFNGIRIQTFPSDKLKIEYWIINGWQSYAMFNNVPGFGFQILWRPVESFQILSNGYYGHDDQDDPGRYRVHSDNSLEYRYFNQPHNSFISRCAFSLTYDIGWEEGDGVNGFHSDGPNDPCQFFISGMVYHRVWFGKKQHFGWTVGGGWINNPGEYLILAPTGQASPLPTTAAVQTANGVVMQNMTSGLYPFTEAPGVSFYGWDCTTAFDWMPSDYFTFEVQIDNRHTNTPYFAGPGGVTSPDGYVTTPVLIQQANGTEVPISGWTPDLVKQETRITLAWLIRF